MLILLVYWYRKWKKLQKSVDLLFDCCMIVAFTFLVKSNIVVKDGVDWKSEHLMAVINLIRDQWWRYYFDQNVALISAVEH